MDNKENTIIYEGTLELNNVTIEYYILKDGTMALSGRGKDELQKILKAYISEEGKTIEPIKHSTLSTFDKSINKALNYNPKK